MKSPCQVSLSPFRDWKDTIWPPNERPESDHAQQNPDVGIKLEWIFKTPTLDDFGIFWQFLSIAVHFFEVPKFDPHGWTEGHRGSRRIQFHAMVSR